jgi:hypothetical protein
VLPPPVLGAGGESAAAADGERGGAAGGEAAAGSGLARLRATFAGKVLRVEPHDDGPAAEEQGEEGADAGEPSPLVAAPGDERVG